MKKFISVSLSAGLLCFCCYSFSLALPPGRLIPRKPGRNPGISEVPKGEFKSPAGVMGMSGIPIEELPMQQDLSSMSITDDFIDTYLTDDLPDEVYVAYRNSIANSLWKEYNETSARAQELGWTVSDLWSVHSELYTALELAKVSFSSPISHLKKACGVVNEFRNSLDAYVTQQKKQAAREQQAWQAVEAQEYQAIIDDTSEMFRLLDRYVALLKRVSEFSSEIKISPEDLGTYVEKKSFMEDIVRRGGYGITSEEATQFLYTNPLDSYAYAYWPINIGMEKNEFYTLLMSVKINIFRRLGYNSSRPLESFRSKKAKECKEILQKAAAELDLIEKKADELAATLSAKAQITIHRILHGIEFQLSPEGASSSIRSPSKHSVHF